MNKLLSFLTLILITPLMCLASENLSLNGEWQIAFDAKNEGRAGEWNKSAIFEKLPGKRSIQVPSCWETIEKDYEGVAFYLKKFKLPAEWTDKTIRIHFDAVNFASEVWINDVAVGLHEGGFTPFDYEINDLLKPGQENTVTVRVAGPILMESKVIEGVGQMETPQWRGAITGGIWQPVQLIASGEAYIDDLFIEPRISDNSATFHLTIEHTGEKDAQSEITLNIAPYTAANSKTTASVSIPLTLKPGVNLISKTVTIPNAVYWSPDNPNLYSTEVVLKCDNHTSEIYRTRFGMREFTIRDKKFTLNNKPLFLKATFFEGLYPVKLAFPDSREMAIREIKLAKGAGFNMIRPWRKPPPPMWLDLCDEIGVLTVGSLAIECMDFPVESARLPGWVENEVRESILRDRSRTCVVQWELFNELKRPVLMRLLRPMANLARELDPTRLILDESGGWAQGANMFLPYSSNPMKFNDIHDYPGPQVNDNVYSKLQLTGTINHNEMKKQGLSGRMPGKNVMLGLMTFFSELGYGSLPDLPANCRQFEKEGNPIVPPTIYHKRMADEHVQVLKESGCDAIYPNLSEFCREQQQIHGEANKRMIEAVRCNPNVEGYCIHALTSGDWIMGAALIDIFRNPKGYVYTGTKEANQPRILSIRIRPRNVYAGRETKIEICGVNESDAVNGTLKVTITDSKGTEIKALKQSVNLKNGISQLMNETLATAKLKGTYKVAAGIDSDNGKTIAINEYDFFVFSSEQTSPPKKRIAIFDPPSWLKHFLKKNGIPFEDFSDKTAINLPVFVTRTAAKNPADYKVFRQLKEFIQRGGTVVYLQGGGPQNAWGKGCPASQLLPVKAEIKPVIGLWNGISHVVKDHPVFKGLPVNCAMTGMYENVWASKTLRNIGGESIVTSIGFDWFPEYDRMKRHYYGSGETWWGSDLAVVPVGKGRCITSYLRLIEHLGKDPVADKVFYNMIEWTLQ